MVALVSQVVHLLVVKVLERAVGGFHSAVIAAAELWREEFLGGCHYN